MIFDKLTNGPVLQEQYFGIFEIMTLGRTSAFAELRPIYIIHETVSLRLTELPWHPPCLHFNHPVSRSEINKQRSTGSWGGICPGVNCTAWKISEGISGG